MAVRSASSNNLTVTDASNHTSLTTTNLGPLAFSKSGTYRSDGLYYEYWRKMLGSNFPDDIITANNVSVVSESKKEEKVPMKTLYNVVLVSKLEKILLDSKVVAEDRDEARFLAGVDTVLREVGLKPGDVTVLCLELGKVKVEEKVQQVRVVKDE